ncbi:MAG: competence damage-inducible protein A [Promethearchaeota archaeon Loki_b32]|nr:MAG: competence damage-inducible protein A [Candidatus Lokiarchaeota archaeon Loki_b32]
MIIELLMIGNEILIGKTQDTNSNWMAKRITKYGHRVKRITTIGDDLEIISSTIRAILKRSPDTVITSGGIGPTFDDMTLQGIANGLNRNLELNQHAYNSIKKVYEHAHHRGLLKLEGMTKERKKMAYLPKGSVPLPNTVGTAPGVKIEEEKTNIFILPGVPAEMKAMFRNIITPILREKKGKFIEKGFLFSGIGESQIAAYTTEMEKKYPQLWIKTHPKIGLSVEVEVSITAFNVENGEELIDKALNEIREIVIKLKGKIKER